MVAGPTDWADGGAGQLATNPSKVAWEPVVGSPEAGDGQASMTVPANSTPANAPTR